MNIVPESYGPAVVLIVKGELVEDSLGAFQKAVDKQLDNDEVIDVIIDLEKVPFLDSSALEYLLDLQDRLAAKLGQVKLVRPDENVRKILEITRLASAFETFEDAAEAVRAMQA